MPQFKYEEITKKIIGAAMKVHSTLGNGFQEVIYQRAMEIEMRKSGLLFVREFNMPIFYDGEQIGERRVDFFVEGMISVELKAREILEKVHYAQARNYLEAYNLEVGLLLNFGGISLEYKRLEIQNIFPILYPQNLFNPPKSPFRQKAGNMKKYYFTFLLFFVCISGFAQPKIWTKEKANAWYKQQPWLVGADFLPSTAINQLEMWQAETFDIATINKELGWAAAIGMNVMRVYLHDLAWKADAKGFKRRMDKFLSIAAAHKIKILFCIFDDCWNPDPVIGKQPEPKPGVHNSGWVRSPSMTVHNDSTQWGYLKTYVTDILTSFKNDKRILLWDLYNEPANSGYGLSSLPLLKKVYQWAWAVRPSQPLSTGVWFKDFPAVNAYQLNNSDVITFHNYDDTVLMKQAIDSLQKLGRPVICTEYMARKNNSKFETHLPILKRYNVAAINWGLVSGKSNTIFPWNSKEGSPEPTPWFHDVFRKDGTPYDVKETTLIKKLTTKDTKQIQHKAH